MVETRRSRLTTRRRARSKEPRLRDDSADAAVSSARGRKKATNERPKSSTRRRKASRSPSLTPKRRTDSPRRSASRTPRKPESNYSPPISKTSNTEAGTIVGDEEPNYAEMVPSGGFTRLMWAVVAFHVAAFAAGKRGAAWDALGMFACNCSVATYVSFTAGRIVDPPNMDKIINYMRNLYGWPRWGFDLVDFIAHGIPAIAMVALGTRWGTSWWDSAEANDLALATTVSSLIFHFGWAFLACGGIDLNSKYLPGAVGDDKVPMSTWRWLWGIAAVGHFTSVVLCNRELILAQATAVITTAVSRIESIRS